MIMIEVVIIIIIIIMLIINFFQGETRIAISEHNLEEVKEALTEVHFTL